MFGKLLKRTLKFFCLVCLPWQQIYAQDECFNPAPFRSFCEDYSCANRFWGDFEYLFWKIKNSPNPTPFIATAPEIHNRDPVIGQPGAGVVLGGRDAKIHWRSGGRFALGFWFDNEQCFGADANYFFLPDGSKKDSVFSSGAPGTPFLSVPFFDTNTQNESSSPVARPGRFRGFAALKVENNMQGAELNGRASLYANCQAKLSLLAGFRYWNFNESLKFFVDSPAVDLPGEVFLVSDHFRTENNFYAGQIGLTFEYYFCRFLFSATGKVALGAMCERLSIRGKFVTNSFNNLGAPINYPGGYFALLSNRGTHKETSFAVMPDVNVNIGYELTDWINIKVGYSFLYVNKVAWAGKQVNRNINPTQSVLYEFTPTPTPTGPLKPKASIRTESLWAQGLNVGVELRY